jgi:hypothetical protein
MGDVVDAVDDFVHGLADRPDEFTVESLDAELKALFSRLESSGNFERGPDAEPLLGTDTWLRAQLKRIESLA